VPKRAELLKVLGELPVARVIPMPVLAAAAPLGDLAVDRQCVGCNVCETLCPSGALRHRDSGAGYALEFEPALCTGCRVCEDACFYKAIHVRESADASVLLSRPHRTLLAAPRQICGACREPFLGESPGLCPPCRVSDRRRAAIARRMVLGGRIA
jgi:formate hydrogenlyase subunit 6/NADH:ubiquinone oxidoreductase subunit I